LWCKVSQQFSRMWRAEVLEKAGCLKTELN
jgi:hypothetical protein